MQESTFISARAFCSHHHIEISFVESLHDYGLIEAKPEAEDYLLSSEQLDSLERLVRLHYDLNINLEGIDAIYHLLQRVEELQNEVNHLRRRVNGGERE